MFYLRHEVESSTQKHTGFLVFQTTFVCCPVLAAWLKNTRSGLLPGQVPTLASSAELGR